MATLLEAGYFMQVAKEHCRMHVSFGVDTCSSAGGSTLEEKNVWKCVLAGSCAGFCEGKGYV